MADSRGGVAVETDDDLLLLSSPDTSESVEEINAKEIEEVADDEEISIEMVSTPPTDDSSMGSPEKKSPNSLPEEQKQLAGWLKLTTGFGFRKAVRNVWFVYGDDTGKLYYYRHPQDLLPLGEIDVRNSSLTYDASNRDKPGLFEVRSGGKVYSIDAQDRVRMQFWLDALQKKRRAFTLKQSSLAQDIFMGRKRQLDASGLLGKGSVDSDKLSTHSLDLDKDVGQSKGFSDEKERPHYWSLLNLRTEIRNVVTTLRSGGESEKPDSEPQSALVEDWTVINECPVPPSSLSIMPQENLQNKSSTQWHVNIDELEASPAQLDTLASPLENQDETQLIGVGFDRTNQSQGQASQSVASPAQINVTPKPENTAALSSSAPSSPLSPNSANGKSKFMSALRNNFKIMKETVKEKNLRVNMSVKHLQSSGVQSAGSGDASQNCYRCKVLSDDLFSVKEDLKAAEEELLAHREIVRLLQKELDVLRSEMNTRQDCVGKNQEDMLKILYVKDKHVVELKHSGATIMEEKSLLAQELRMKDNELKELRDQICMFQQTLAVKDEIIISLTNTNQELKNSPGVADRGDNTSYSYAVANNPVSLEADRKELERLTDTCKAYEEQNHFLTKEILELNALRQHDEARERLLMMNVAKLEAQYYQTRSKYLYLLNEKHVPVRGGDENKSQEVVNQLLQEALETEANESQVDVNRQTFISSQGKEYDHYGFLKYGHGDDDFLVSRANILERQSVEIEYMLRDNEEETSKRIKWENFMVGQSPNKPLLRSPEIKALLRLGIPHEFREHIWKRCIELYVRPTRIKLGDKYYKDLEERADNNKSNPAIKQIELDLLRTLPDNRFFENIDSSGIKKLRRILLCYSIHNPLIGYCQGINRLAAIALLFLCEEDAFWCLVAIIEHLMPVDYYTTTLAAAQTDQRVLKDLVQDKCPKLYAHMELNDVDVTLFTFNLFLTIFVDGVHPELFLRIWDVFLYEGSKVLFRFAVAFLKYAEDEILKQPNNLAINRYMRVLGQTITDVKRITNIAFSELNPFPMRSISSRRTYHLQQVKLELEELECIRKDLRSAHEEDEGRGNVQGYFSEEDLD
ncbi:hypothetical protein BsWGS_19952 [Bradybaena similaris]